MIEIEEEETTAKSDEQAQEQPWSEEFTVAGIDLVATIKDLIHEVSIRRIEIRDKEGKRLLEIPLVVGVLGVAILNFWASLALIAAFVAEVSILVVRAEKPVDEGEEIEITVADDEPAEVVVSEADFEVVEAEDDIEIIIHETTDTNSGAGLVNINDASVAALVSLPGIAASTAERIIAYREANGNFADISELTNVSGIGKAKLEQLAGLITV